MKLLIDTAEYAAWCDEQWTLYASCTVAGAPLRWHVNHAGVIDITHGGAQLYRGSDPQEALKAWQRA